MSLELFYWLETTQPVLPESLCPWPGSLLIPDNLDSKRCQQSRSEDLEHRRAATKSPNRSLADRIARFMFPGRYAYTAVAIRSASDLFGLLVAARRCSRSSERDC